MAGREYRMRKRAEGLDATRERIVEATAALHYEQGVEATSYVQIAERAGVGPATVYRHFPTLGSLVEACGVSRLGRDSAADAGERAGRLCGPRHAAGALWNISSPSSTRSTTAPSSGSDTRPATGTRARARCVPAACRRRRRGAGPGGDGRRLSGGLHPARGGPGGPCRVAVVETARRAAGGVPAHHDSSAGLRDRDCRAAPVANRPRQRAAGARLSGSEHARIEPNARALPPTGSIPLPTQPAQFDDKVLDVRPIPAAGDFEDRPRSEVVAPLELEDRRVRSTVEIAPVARVRQRRTQPLHRPNQRRPAGGKATVEQAVDQFGAHAEISRSRAQSGGRRRSAPGRAARHRLRSTAPAPPPRSCWAGRTRAKSSETRGAARAPACPPKSWSARRAPSRPGC